MRFRIKSVLIPGLIVATAVMLSAIAVGQPRFQAKHGAGAGLMGPGLLERVGDEIGLEAAQKEQIKKLHLETQKRTIELRSQAELARLELRTALDKDKPSEAEVLKAAARANEAQGKIQAEKLKSIVRVKNILKPEQTAKLKELRREHRSNRMERPKMGRGRPGMQGHRPFGSRIQQRPFNRPVWP
ncbi:Spy/CpxP family protein refolding chaperone [candidate division KSB1 bacterium]